MVDCSINCKEPFQSYCPEIPSLTGSSIQKPLLSLPDKCDGCGASFNVNHTLSCRREGVIEWRHNEVRDAIGNLATLVWSKVSKEPVVQEAREGDCLVADLRIRGVWFHRLRRYSI